MVRLSVQPGGEHLSQAWPNVEMPTLAGWYTDPRNPEMMLWWDGLRWKDADRPPPPQSFNWILHFLLFVVCAVILYAGISFVVGLIALPFALRATGRRGRDLFMLLIPLWGTIVLVQTVWRLSDRRISWLPRPDLPSRPIFGSAILPNSVLPLDLRAAMGTANARFHRPGPHWRDSE